MPLSLGPELRLTRGALRPMLARSTGHGRGFLLGAIATATIGGPRYGEVSHYALCFACIRYCRYLWWHTTGKGISDAQTGLS